MIVYMLMNFASLLKTIQIVTVEQCLVEELLVDVGDSCSCGYHECCALSAALQQSNAAVCDLSKYPSESGLMEEHQGSQVVTYPTAATAVIGKEIGEFELLTSVNV